MPYKAIKKYKSGTFLCKEFPSIQQKALKFKNESDNLTNYPYVFFTFTFQNKYPWKLFPTSLFFLLNSLIFISCNTENSVEKEPETTTPKVKTEKVPIEKIEEGIRQYITETTGKSGGDI